VIVRPDSRLVNALYGSPNIEARRPGMKPSILLLHYTGMRSAALAIDRLARPESKVSCHYVVDEEGKITQMVAERRRAWHAGQAVWAGESDINSASIGIEIQNPGHEDGYPDFPEAQIAAVIALGLDICERNGIAPARVLAHSDVAPHRKIDPGEKFPWSRLALADLGLWIEPEPLAGADSGELSDESTVRAAQEALVAYGYGIEPSGGLDQRTRHVIKAFQRHFRPARVDGILDRSTLVTLERLCARAQARFADGLAIS
jgi:N-acetylmuramoyl-L-alanine amidase